MGTHEIESKVRELRQLRQLIAEAEAEAEAITDEIKAHMGDTEELRAGEYSITYKAVKSSRIDTVALVGGFAILAAIIVLAQIGL